MQHLGNLKAAIKLNWKPIFSLQRLHNKPVLLLASKWMHRNNKKQRVFLANIFIYGGSSLSTYRRYKRRYLNISRVQTRVSVRETRVQAATIYWAHISSLHRYSRHYKFKLNFHERFHVHIQPQWIHVLILWSYHWKVNVKFIEQIQKNIFKLNLQMTNHINAF